MLAQAASSAEYPLVPTCRVAWNCISDRTSVDAGTWGCACWYDGDDGERGWCCIEVPGCRGAASRSMGPIRPASYRDDVGGAAVLPGDDGRES